MWNAEPSTSNEKFKWIPLRGEQAYLDFKWLKFLNSRSFFIWGCEFSDPHCTRLNLNLKFRTYNILGPTLDRPYQPAHVWSEILWKLSLLLISWVFRRRFDALGEFPRNEGVHFQRIYGQNGCHHIWDALYKARFCRAYNTHATNSKSSKFLQQMAAINVTFRIWFYCLEKSSADFSHFKNLH